MYIKLIQAFETLGLGRRKNMGHTEQMTQEHHFCKREFECPVKNVIDGIENIRDKNRKIVKSIINARLKAWKTVRFIADRRIESLEKKIVGGFTCQPEKKATTIAID